MPSYTRVFQNETRCHKSQRSTTLKDEGYIKKHPYITFGFLLFLITSLLTFCFIHFFPVWNNPYPSQDDTANIFYTSFAEPPKTFDPAKSYSSDEYAFTTQIYESVLQYHYLKRPYVLIPLTAQTMPSITYLDKNGKEIVNTTNTNTHAAYSVYTIQIKPGIYYQPHPAFAKNPDGQYIYYPLPENFWKKNKIKNISDFEKTAARELTADDYIYQIKRLGSPAIQSPIFGLMKEYIKGLEDFSDHLPLTPKHWIDLRKLPLAGVKKIDRYTYQIILKGVYPPFSYWLAMPFFAPMPWEAERFYQQPGMQEHNITLDTYPVGTGAYYLTENNPNSKIVLEKNPHFHEEYYPDEGMLEDAAAGLLKKAGQRLPFIDKVVFSLEKESIPRWNKFLQGYYDDSGISNDNFDEAITMDNSGFAAITPDMKEKGIYLTVSLTPVVFYWGFNMLDKVVGGHSEKARKLRQAISLAFNMKEYVFIFLNDSAEVQQGPIPPSIFGGHTDKTHYNRTLYDWKNGRPVKKPLSEAKKLLAEAGYPNGRDPKTGRALVLNYDVAVSSAPDSKANFDWIRKQFNKLGLQLNIRSTQYNRFQEKIRLGNAQFFSFGWHADYPDPENFLGLLYGPNGEVKFSGSNAANYANSRYDILFQQIKNMPDSTERLALIKKMLTIIQKDAPWIWGYSPKVYILNQSWKALSKPAEIGSNTLKYQSIDPIKRAELRRQWNQPVLWPILLLWIFFALLCLIVYLHYRKKEFSPPKKLP